MTKYTLEHNDVLNKYRIPDGPLNFWLREERGPEKLGNRLTTPVAYITEVPWDIFNTEWRRFALPTHKKKVSVMMNSKTLRSEIFLLYNKFNWNIHSVGPDMAYWNIPPGHQLVDKIWYDPTNGAVSAGDIWYFNAWGFGHPLDNDAVL